MMRDKRTIARCAALTMVILATGALVGVIRSDTFRQAAAGSPVDPKPCVATIFPDDAYYQAIAELNACTGRAVRVPIGGTRAFDWVRTGAPTPPWPTHLAAP